MCLLCNVLQKELQVLPTFEFKQLENEGFESKCFIGGKEMAIAIGRSKKVAKNTVAEIVLKREFP